MNKLWHIHLMEHCTTIKIIGYIYEYIQTWLVSRILLKLKKKKYVLLIFEQHGFKLCRSTYTRVCLFFSITICTVFNLWLEVWKQRANYMLQSHHFI